MGATHEADMRAAMSSVQFGVWEMRDALTTVNGLLGPTTWQGPKADEFAGDWHALKTRTDALLERINTEIQRLIGQAMRQDTEERNGAAPPGSPPPGSAHGPR